MAQEKYYQGELENILEALGAQPVLPLLRIGAVVPFYRPLIRTWSHLWSMKSLPVR